MSNPKKSYSTTKIETIDERQQSSLYWLRQANNKLKNIKISSIVHDWEKQLSLRACTKVDVLDIACGKGGDCFKFFYAFQNNKLVLGTYYGFDESKTSIQEAKERTKELKWNGKFETLTLAEYNHKNLIASVEHLQKRLCFVNFSMCIHYLLNDLDACLLHLTKSILPQSRVLISCLSWPWILHHHFSANASTNTSTNVNKEWKNEKCHIQLLENQKCFFRLEGHVQDPETMVNDQHLIAQFRKYNFRLIEQISFYDMMKRLPKNIQIGLQTNLEQLEIFYMYQFFDFVLDP